LLCQILEKGAVMNATIVRYRVKQGRTQENAELVRAVYAELAEKQPAGFHYGTFVLDDGVSFMHVALLEEGHEAPLGEIAAFQRFTADIAERVEQPPETTRATELVGSYGF
jgi:hypothetical protein